MKRFRDTGKLKIIENSYATELRNYELQLTKIRDWHNQEI